MTNTEIIVNLATIIAKQSLEISELKTEVQHLHHELLATMNEAEVKDEPQPDNGIGCSRCDGRYDCCDRDTPYAVYCNNYGKITD